ncbi:cadherin domain-containing protein, partial [Labilibaculum sp.]|uniref:cadherin domain-containing protein n=1 Tax=Labilibaculum sp. TaxID=2060723 RepID=UPI003566DA46
IGTEVGTLTAIDEDSDQSFTYAITENDNFEISEDKLVTKTSLDFETPDSYSVEITVTDQGGLTYAESLSITITDANDAPTAIQLSNATIAENSAIGTEVGTLTATDVDADQTFTYTLSENKYFETNGDQIVSKDEFNFEDHISYSVKVIVSDQDGLIYDDMFTLHVTDVNEAPEFLSEPILEATVGEEYIYSIEYTDFDNDVCTVSAIEIPAWITLVDNEDGTASLSGIPGEGGNFSISLEVSDAEYGETQEFEIEVASITGIEDVFTEPEVSIYPNPVANELHVDLSDYNNTDFTISLHSMSGAQLYRQDYESTGGEAQVSFSVQALQSGFYFLLIESDDYRKSYKIVKL